MILTTGYRDNGSMQFELEVLFATFCKKEDLTKVVFVVGYEDDDVDNVLEYPEWKLNCTLMSRVEPCELWRS